MFHSIKFKFFAAICAIAVVFIGILTALNLTLYDNYYIWQRHRALNEIYTTLRTAYAADDGDQLVSLILQWEDTEGVRLSLVAPDGTVGYDSVVRQRLSGIDGAPESLVYGLTITENALRMVDMEQVRAHGAAFVNVSDGPRDEEFLCLVGQLGDDGSYLVVRTPFTYMEQNSLFNMVFLVVSGSATLIICIFLAFFISRFFTKPLLSIRDVAGAIAALDFSKRYVGSVNDEIGQLGHTINLLSDHLSETIAELRASNEQLALEIREKEKVDMMRREFIVNVSHELKTPIALIQGYAEGLREGVAETAEDREYYCTTITDEAVRMNQLVMQLLNLSKLEQGREMPAVSEFELDDLLETAAAKAGVLAEGRGLQIHCAGCGLSVRTDYAMLEQVVNNYLTNAVRYTPNDGKIEIWAENTQDGARITVRNEGEGVAESELPRLWDKFYRTDKARSRESGGTGVGLSIVRATAEVLGGAYGCRNVAGGMEFWFFAPNAEK